MKHPLYPEPLTSITVDGKTIPVISLPQEVQNEIATLNLYAQEFTTAMLDLEKADILLKHKKSQVEQLIKNALKPAVAPAPEPEAD
jgi:hypothetical protein